MTTQILARHWCPKIKFQISDVEVINSQIIGLQEIYFILLIIIEYIKQPLTGYNDYCK